MDSNTHSNRPPEPPGPPTWLEPSEDLAELATVVDKLAAKDLERLSVTVRARRLLAWRQQLNRQEGLWLQEVAALDASEPPGPTKASSSAQPRPGCATGCA